MRPSDQIEASLNPLTSPSLKSWGDTPKDRPLPQNNVIVECGWGRLAFAHTFTSNTNIADVLADEKAGYRDLAIYLRDPHVVVAKAPQELFIDPSFTYRLLLTDWDPPAHHDRPYLIRSLNPTTDIEAVNRIYRARGMVVVDEGFLRQTNRAKAITYYVAEDKQTGRVLGVSMGIDHGLAFADPENGSSLWALAVDPQAPHPGIGVALVNHIAEGFYAKGRSFMDVSVMHDNTEAIGLYEHMGFHQVPVFCVKNKNAINETLFTASAPDEHRLNPYATVITDEARRRGIRVDVLDPVDNYFRLSFGGRSVTCRESLSDLTSAIAMSQCADKATCYRLFSRAGLRVPAQQVAASPAANHAFLEQYGALVVKPAVGEQGAGITMDVTTKNELEDALQHAAQVHHKVILEEMVQGDDVRIVVIDDEVVAAAVRRPPEVVGTGRHSILELVHKQSRRREQATGGESRIPLDDELNRTVANAGYILDDVLPTGESLVVRRTANLHTGGTIHDITPDVHPELKAAAIEAARVLNIPVVGLDLLVPDYHKPDYVIIEANERPGLANHEPQPTAERFVDMLFPQSKTRNPNR